MNRAAAKGCDLRTRRMAACASCTARKSLQSVFVAASRSVDDLALQFVCEAPFAEAVIGGGDALKRVLLAVHRENAERQQDESGGREGAHVQRDDAALIPSGAGAR
jgi:hypothetical protein